MNIKSTTTKPQTRSVTITIPKVELDTISDGIWSAADSVALGAQRVFDSGKKLRSALGPLAKRGKAVATHSLMNATPVIGLFTAASNRQAYAKGQHSSTPLTRLNNAALGAAQMAGLATAGLSAASFLTGIGSPGPLLTLSGRCFAAGAVLGVINATHTSPEFFGEDTHKPPLFQG